MRLFALLFITVCVICPARIHAQNKRIEGAARPLDTLVTGSNLWETTKEQFEQQFKDKGLQWLSKDKDQARFFGGGLSLFNGEIKVLEAVAEFNDGKLSRVKFSLYNRGDSTADPGNSAEFESMVKVFKDTISAHVGTQAVDRGKDASSAVKAMVLAWNKAPITYLLEYSYQKELKNPGKAFRPEFIRLRVAPVPKQASLGASIASGNNPVARNSLISNLAKAANGDVFIKNVPMVDQGPKGYCVVATAERVFKYLGLDVDQHEMAAVANSTSSHGTNPEAMVEALKKLTGRLKVHIRELQPWNYTDFNKLISDYNRAAKKNKKREVNIAGMRNIDLGAIYSSFDPESLKESRTAPGKGAFTKFQREVAGAIDRGVPLMWSVELGLFKEGNLPQSHGGHMRLIIGYNLKSGEILYSDSWGAAHALKRMPMDNACAMTTGLYYLEPLQ